MLARQVLSHISPVQGMITRSFSARVPSISFTHGNRAQIAQDISALPEPTWFVKDWTKEKIASTLNTVVSTSAERRVGETVTRGGVSTRVTFMEDGFYGNPFNNGKPTFALDQTAIDMIQLGGAKI